MQSTSVSPLVSVIIPTFNRAPEVCRAINSVLKQTVDQFEIIVIDNCSRDDTISMVSQINDSRIKCISIENEGVIARSRNVGIKNSSGLFLAFLDSDDYWEENKLEKSISALKQGADFVFHDMRLEYIDITNSATKKILKGRKLGVCSYEELLLSGNRVNLSTVVCHRNILMGKGFCEDTKFVGFEDYLLWVDLAKNGCKFLYIKNFSGAVYTVGDNFSTSKREVILLRNFRRAFKEEFRNRFDSNSVGWINYRLGLIQFQAKRFPLAVKFFWTAILLPGRSSLKIRALVFLFLSGMRSV